MLNVLKRSVSSSIGGFIDWLDQTHVLGTICILMFSYIFFEILTGFPSWYLGRIFEGLRLFVTDYLLLGML